LVPLMRLVNCSTMDMSSVLSRWYSSMLLAMAPSYCCCCCCC
jgi:hypothetical protein